jgi:hypothetical protein
MVALWSDIRTATLSDRLREGEHGRNCDPRPGGDDEGECERTHEIALNLVPILPSGADPSESREDTVEITGWIVRGPQSAGQQRGSTRLQGCPVSKTSMETVTGPRRERSDPRLLELIGTLSLATDLAMGQPMESGLGTCSVATRLGETLGLGEDDLRDVHYLSLLQHIGCTVMNHELAAVVGDEIAMRAGAAAIDLSDPEVATP